MANRSIVMDEFVGADAISADDVRCPRQSCKSNNLMLYGNSQVTRIETMENGEITGTKIDEGSHAFELEIIECMMCGTRWRIKTREVMALEERNEQLRQMVIAATGRDPYGHGRPN